MLDTFFDLSRLFAVDTSSISLDQSSYVLYKYFWGPTQFWTTSNIWISLSLSTFDPRPFFSLKSFFPFHFRLHPSLLHLVSALDLSFFSFFMYFMHHACKPRFSSFFFFFFWGGGGTWCFCVFVKIFGMGFGNLILHAYALHSMFIITMFHAFRIMWWLYLVSVVTLD